MMAAAWGIAVSACGAGGKTLRIVSYNIDCADQASDNNITGATHSLSTVVQAIGLHHIGTNAQPIDVMSCEELRSTTLSNFSVALNNIYGAGTYTFDPTTDPNTGGGPDGLIYNTQTIQVISARALLTGQNVLLQSNGTYTAAFSPGGGVNGVTRAPMVYRLRPIGHGTTNDFYMYVSHARSTSDDSVGDARYAEAQEIRSDAKYNLPAGSHILYAGDWNLFNGSGENAYKCLTGQTTSDAINWSDTSAIWGNTNQTQAYDPTSKTTPPTTTTWANVSGDNARYLYGDSTSSETSRIDIQLPNALMFGVYNNQGGVQLAPDTGDPFDSSNFPSSQYPYAFEVFGNNGTTARSGSVTSSANHSLDDLTNTVPNAATVYSDILLTGSGSSFTGSDHYPIVGDYNIVEFSTGTAPSISSGPAGRTNAVGTTATFNVTASGTAPLGYQWQKNAVNLSNTGNVSGVTTTNLTVTNVTFNNAGSYTVVVSNSIGMATSSVAVLTVVCPTISVGPGSLVNGTAGTSYDQTNSASGGGGPYHFTVTTGLLPAGLNINTNTGVISGTPTVTGTNTFTVTASDTNGCAGSAGYTVVIGCPVITVGPAGLPNGTANASYLATNTASGGIGISTFTVTSGLLPVGLNLNTNTGVISGTPTVTGTNIFTVTASDANGCAGSAGYTVVIGCPVITVGPAGLPNGTANASYLETNTASGGIGIGTFTVTSGLLPVGLNLNTNTGVISGTPTVTGTNIFTVTASDANGCAGSAGYTVVIGCPAITVGPETLPDGSVNTAYLATNTASGGVGSVQFAVTSGLLPTGLSINTNSGIISGTPTVAGTNLFTVTATDANGCTGSSSYTVSIAGPTNAVNSVSFIAEGFETNGIFSFTLSAATNANLSIQASTNLTDWTSIGSGFTDTNGILFFEDTNTAGFPSRYYRAVSPP